MLLSVSEGIGNGTLREVQISEAIEYDWCQFMNLNIKLECSSELRKLIKWHCQQGVSKQNMKMLNEEFNHFRGLFPLKVFISGPPCSGKTHFAKKLNELYGIPHIKIQDIVDLGKSLTNDLGNRV